MENYEYIALRAKVKVANSYLEQALRHKGKIDPYDISKVVTARMRPQVEIVDPEIAKEDGLGIVRIRQAV